MMEPERVTAVFARKVQGQLPPRSMSRCRAEQAQSRRASRRAPKSAPAPRTSFPISSQGAARSTATTSATPARDSIARHERADRLVPLQRPRRAALRPHHRREHRNARSPSSLDDKVLSAPVIREPITGGSGQISGNLTIEEANTVAMMLRAGALPGRLTVVEQQVVDASAKR